MLRLLVLPLLLLLAVPTGPAGASEEPKGVWPLHPRPAVVERFDPPDVTWGSGHRGVDLLGRVGQGVRAALPGRVSFTGVIAGVPVVVVDHGATRTTYQPVTAGLPRGTQVAAGQVIGHLQLVGGHCLPRVCLHWGLLAGDRYLDPLTLVGGPLPVRLLPLAVPDLRAGASSWGQALPVLVRIALPLV